MMRRLIIVLIFSGAFSLVKAQVFEPENDPNAPIIKFDSLIGWFDTVYQGSIVDHEFHFTNKGKSPLLISDVTGSSGSVCPSYPKEPIAPGKSAFIRVVFHTGGKMGPQEKSVTVRSNATEPMIVLRIKGFVTLPPPDPNAPIIKFDETTFNCDTIPIGETVIHEFKFTNTGKTPLIITNVPSNGGDFTPDAFPKEPIPPGSSGVIKVSYRSAGKPGPIWKTQGVYSNGSTYPVTLTLSGYVHDPSAPQMMFDHLEFNFDSVIQGDTVKHSFRFTNRGKLPLVITDAYSSCGCVVTEYSKEPIPPGMSGTIFVEFRSAGKMGGQDKIITVKSNNGGGDIVLHIKGKVVLPENRAPNNR